MKAHIKFALAAGLGVILLTAACLLFLQSLQRLGTPGVRLVQREVLREDGQIIGTNTVPLPETILNYKSKEIPVAKVVSDWLPKDTTYATRIYEAPDRFQMQATVVLMGTDRTSIHRPEDRLVGQGFQQVRTEDDRVAIARAGSSASTYELPVKKMIVRRQLTTPSGAVNQAGVYAYWFVADQQLTADHGQRMWWMARDLITRGVLQRWAYISCFSVCAPGQEEAAYARIREWITVAVPEFQLASAAGLARAP